ncbi:MAG: DUF2911 domain-containing protein [Pseudomonadota bacterium]
MPQTLRNSSGILAIFFLTLGLAMPDAASAEELIQPRVSPRAEVHQRIGITDVTLTYHRPAVRERAVWGELVPYDEVWRLGANNATTLEVSTDVTVAGKALPAGRYALFAIPNADRWTFVVNGQADQWGSYGHQDGADALRFDLPVEKGSFHEWMTFRFEPTVAEAGAVPSAAMLHFHWAEAHVAFPIAVDVETTMWTQLDGALDKLGDQADQASARVYLMAANYALDTDKRLDDAMTWTERALDAAEGFWTHEARAKVLHRHGKKDKALAHLTKAMEMAEGKTPAGYMNRLRALQAEWTGGDAR